MLLVVGNPGWFTVVRLSTLSLKAGGFHSGTLQYSGLLFSRGQYDAAEVIQPSPEAFKGGSSSDAPS